MDKMACGTVKKDVETTDMCQEKRNDENIS